MKRYAGINCKNLYFYVHDCDLRVIQASTTLAEQYAKEQYWNDKEGKHAMLSSITRRRVSHATSRPFWLFNTHSHGHSKQCSYS